MNRLVSMVLKNLFYIPGAWIRLCRYAKHPENYSEMEMYSHIQSIIRRALPTANVDLQVWGKENIPQENGFVLYGNHQGLFDVMALCASFDGPLSCVYKKELSGVPFLKQVLRCTYSLEMNREDVRQSLTVIQNVTQEVLKGRNYLIFPEGTRSKNGNTVGAFHPGSFRAAVKAKAPIVPFALIDSFRVLDQKGSQKVTVQLYYLPAIPYEEYKDLKTTELAELVRGRIVETVEANLKKF